MPRLWPPYDPDRLDQREPEHVARCARVVRAVHARWHRAEVRGLEHIPPDAALYVGNHSGGLWTPDTFIFCQAVHDARGIVDVPYGLAHDLGVDVLPLNRLMVPLGAVRAAPGNAERLLAAGRKVLVYPGGDEDALRPFRQRGRVVFGGRRGYARLALRTGAPIVPVVASGAHSGFVVLSDMRRLARLLRADRWARLKVFPLILCAPWGLAVGPAVLYLPYPSKVLVEVLPPIAPEGTAGELAERVEAAMQAALDRLEAERRSRKRA
jgi:1-acyl-sn-glycerol-3-phosphate acyltransferase